MTSSFSATSSLSWFAAIRQRVRVPMHLKSGEIVTPTVISFEGLSDQKEHVALVFDAAEPVHDAPLVRLHSECLTGDVFGSSRCDCGPQLDEALRRMSVEGGVILYLRQEGRGIGLYNKLDAYALQIDQGMDTFTSNAALGHGLDDRSYEIAAQMLSLLQIDSLRLLSNNPEKAAQLETHGIKVTERIPTGVHMTHDNDSYLKAKKKSGHSLAIDE